MARGSSPRFRRKRKMGDRLALKEEKQNKNRKMKKKKQIPVYLEERAIRSNSGGASLHHLSKSCGFSRCGSTGCQEAQRELLAMRSVSSRFLIA